jgi:NADH:ubiquinone oxidoreductase subunit 3 (subunit A)
MIYMYDLLFIQVDITVTIMMLLKQSMQLSNPASYINMTLFKTNS